MLSRHFQAFLSLVGMIALKLRCSYGKTLPNESVKRRNHAVELWMKQKKNKKKHFVTFIQPKLNYICRILQMENQYL